jgi:hypothetical protein
MDLLSKFCIWKAVVINKEPYYSVKIVHRTTKEIKYIFLNYSFMCRRWPGNGSVGSISPPESFFEGDIRGLAPILDGWIVKNAIEVK